MDRDIDLGGGMGVFLDKTKDGYVEYDAIFLDPQNLGVLNNDIAMTILKEMTYQPMCAMDLARKLGHHEQKIYYHLNKLQRAGIIKLVGTEKRYGMVAQLYDLVSPVIAAKIHDTGKLISSTNEPVRNQTLLKFLYPFVENGKMNAKVIVGDPYPHGKFNSSGKSAAYIFDFAMLIGNNIKDPIPSLLVDTKVSDKDLIGNLIIIGNIKENVVLNRFNDSLKYKFDEGKNFNIIDNKGNTYDDPRIGVIMKTTNPLNPSSKILVLAGVGSRGTKSAIIALTKEFDKIAKYMEDDENLYLIVEGIDMDGDGVLDSVNIIE